MIYYWRRDSRLPQYILEVDQNARFKNKPEVFCEEVFYGQLLDIFVVRLPSDERLGLARPTTTILVQILPCNLIASPIPNIPVYKNMKTGPEMVNINTIKCAIGRIKDEHNYYILDRSSTGV